MSHKALITGATGDTGRPAVRESLKAGLVVRAMVRAVDDRSKALADLGTEIVVGDHHEIDTIKQAMEGMDAAYFVYPVAPGLITATVNFVQAAKEAGVSTLVNLSQRLANRNSKSWSCRDSFIAEEVYRWSGLSFVNLRPTYFLEWLLYPWQLPLLANEGILRLPVGKGRHSPICSSTKPRRALASRFSFCGQSQEGIRSLDFPQPKFGLGIRDTGIAAGFYEEFPSYHRIFSLLKTRRSETSSRRCRQVNSRTSLAKPVFRPRT